MRLSYWPMAMLASSSLAAPQFVDKMVGNLIRGLPEALHKHGVDVTPGPMPPKPCMDWGGLRNYRSLKRWNSAQATVCFRNDTVLEGHDGGWPLEHFTEADVKVAKCMIKQHHNHGYKCMTIKDSPCDKGYSNTTGQLKNVRIRDRAKNWAGLGWEEPGKSNTYKISEDEMHAGMEAIETLLDKTITSGPDTIGLWFWDPKGDHKEPSPNTIAFDFKLGGFDC